MLNAFYNCLILQKLMHTVDKSSDFVEFSYSLFLLVRSLVAKNGVSSSSFSIEI